ncbi:DUF397 domain-containing protein [Spongiactinospora rosea]|uniref:DUF397 domain-containing protein n=1 Tax=Spongiactinospora rosea TaxID=2248750 RepID=UPI001CED3B98|nr:DUF397 domain-containing protein [Spongiactinospora rosea]
MINRNDVDISSAVWVKSTWSMPAGENCVEVARVGAAFAVRDSKRPDEAHLLFSRDEWQAFIHAVKNDQLNNT